MLTPELGIPYDKSASFVDMFSRATAACNTAEFLGLQLEANEEDQEIAAKLVKSYAADADATSKAMTAPRAAQMRPASLILTGKILAEYGQEVVEDAMQIRHMVTNKLVLESENPDARVRLRSLELLGKISDVGLFSDKVEVTHTHRSSEELRAALKAKLEKHVAGDAEFPEAAEGEYSEVRAIDVDDALGVS